MSVCNVKGCNNLKKHIMFDGSRLQLPHSTATRQLSRRSIKPVHFFSYRTLHYVLRQLFRLSVRLSDCKAIQLWVNTVFLQNLLYIHHLAGYRSGSVWNKNKQTTAIWNLVLASMPTIYCNRHIILHQAAKFRLNPTALQLCIMQLWRYIDF